MISYAQNFEDVILNRVFRDRDDGFYIDVGAMDPVLESVTKFFYDRGWSGINIEPNEWFYNKLVADRPRDINLKVALGETEEQKDLYVFERFGISTFEESSRDRAVEKGFTAKPVPVKMTTLAAICEEYVTRPIDFLKIDCEGWEKFVIKGADWRQFRPTVLIIEATEPLTTIPSWQEWEPWLIENAHYDMVYFDGLNRYYLNRDSAALRSHFAVPANVLDEFQPYALVRAEQTSHTLQEERDSLRNRIVVLEEKIRAVNAEKELLRNELLAAQAHTSQLDQSLVKTRLWIGQLSQELAANRRR
jgi:FkbM family methyltransferase